jgi:hypothetical protein
MCTLCHSGRENETAHDRAALMAFRRDVIEAMIVQVRMFVVPPPLSPPMYAFLPKGCPGDGMPCRPPTWFFPVLAPVVDTACVPWCCLCLLRACLLFDRR